MPEFLEKGLDTKANCVYYNVAAFQGKQNQHRLWLCPVTEYVFKGSYPAPMHINSIT